VLITSATAVDILPPVKTVGDHRGIDVLFFHRHRGNQDAGNLGGAVVHRPGGSDALSQGQMVGGFRRGLGQLIDRLVDGPMLDALDKTLNRDQVRILAHDDYITGLAITG
jgi:hypothetical protein